MPPVPTVGPVPLVHSSRELKRKTSLFFLTYLVFRPGSTALNSLRYNLHTNSRMAPGCKSTRGLNFLCVSPPFFHMCLTASCGLYGRRILRCAFHRYFMVFYIFFNTWNRRCCCPAGQHTQLLCCDNIMLDLQWVFSHGTFLVFTKIAKTSMNVMVVVIQEFI